MTLTILKKHLTLAVIIIAALSPNSSKAQYDTDIGVRLGAAFYFGDLTSTGEEKKAGPLDIQFAQTGLNIGITGRRFLSPSFAVQGALNYARLRGTDKISGINTHYSRNLSFRNDIFELSARLEYHFLKIRDVGRTYRYKLNFNSFIFAGVGGFYHNPKAEYNGSWVALQPLETEGVSYSKFAVAVPMGLGFEFRINKKHIIGWDVGVRMTFTDYIDDVSGNYLHHSKFDDDPQAKALQDRSIEIEPTDPLYVDPKHYSYGTNVEEAGKRGNPETNDWYMWSGVTYKYALRNKRKKFNRRKYHFARRKVKKRRSRAKF